MRRHCTWILLAGIGLLAAPRAAAETPYFRPLDLAWADGRWRASVYAGALTGGGVTDILLRGDPQWDRFGLVALGLGREIGSTLEGALRMEWEANLAWRHERGREIADLRVMVGGRWTAFPWNRWLPTTAAFLIGPSWHSATSRYEDETGRARPWAVGHVMELTFAAPGWQGTRVMLRLHHRSSVFGWMGEGTPSDALALGLRWHF